MISFNKAMESVEDGDKPSILLGNGFSRAWRNDIFNYANLLEAAEFNGRDAEIRDLFVRLRVVIYYDFHSRLKGVQAHDHRRNQAFVP